MLCGPLFLLEVIDKNGLTQRNFLLAAAAFVAYLGWEMARRARPPGALGDEQLAGGPQSSGGSQTYGDEKPLPPEDRSEAWRENRRSETTL